MTPRSHTDTNRPGATSPLQASALRADFERYRLRGLRSYVRLGALPLFATVCASVSVLYWLFAHEMTPTDRRIVLLGSTGVVTAVAVGAVGVQFQRVRRVYGWYVSPLACLVLLKLGITPQLLSHPDAAITETYFAALSIVVVTLALRLPFWLLAVTDVLSAVIVLSVMGALGQPALAYAHFAFYFGATSCVCLYVAFMMQQQEKRAFLQSLIIEDATRVTEALNHELHRMAHQDALSGLANRREFDRRIACEWEEHQRAEGTLALLFIDVDHFKAFNDHYGHAAGDDTLARIGTAIGGVLRRAHDLAARYGGEEFVILLPDTQRSAALDVARRVVDAVDRLEIPHASSPTGRVVSVSVGVAALVPVSTLTLAALVERADQALYLAKAKGRHQVAEAHASP